MNSRFFRVLPGSAGFSRVRFGQVIGERTGGMDRRMGGREDGYGFQGTHRGLSQAICTSALPSSRPSLLL
jgi:hypothetical protein